jgi:hypothetical protein
MLYACFERFDVMSGRENILGWDGEVNKAMVFLAKRTGLWYSLPYCVSAGFEVNIWHLIQVWPRC